MNIIEETVGTYRVEITGMTIRQIKDVFEDKWGVMVWSGGGAYPSGDIELQFKKAQAAQPERAPLSDDQIRRLADSCTPNTETGSLNYGMFARAIEAAHGIKQGDQHA